VLVVAQHPVIRGIVRTACEGMGADRVEDAVTIDEARDATGSMMPDLIVLDLDLPTGGAPGYIQEVVERGSLPAAERIRVVVLSNRDDGRAVVEAMRAGADGYLTKAQGLRELVTAMRRIGAGERVLSEGLEGKVHAEVPRFARNSRERARVEGLLTQRERQVLAFLADGLTLRQIGRRLGISPRTVETHVAKLCRKLGASTRMQVVSRAAALGLLELR
jgi:DNA-binding NarL/FixJ family response regulator